MEKGWENFLIPCVNTCTEVVDKHRIQNRLVAPNRSVVCNKCDTYSVIDEVKNLNEREKVDTYLVEVYNIFNYLKEAELENRVDAYCCLAAQVVKKCTSNNKGVQVQTLGKDNIILVKESKKPVILVKSDKTFMTALLDTGSE